MLWDEFDYEESIRDAYENTDPYETGDGHED